jgi:ribosomal protein S18 acetylase RimI-like enzyme
MPASDSPSTVTYRWMTPAELHRLSEIDRGERIRVRYTVDGDRLREMDVERDIPNWLDQGDHDHTLAYQIAFCQSHFDAGGKVLGAFEQDRLVGIGVLSPDLRPGMAQLAYLHVSNGHRRRGIAGRLCAELAAEARGWDLAACTCQRRRPGPLSRSTPAKALRRSRSPSLNSGRQSLKTFTW